MVKCFVVLELFCTLICLLHFEHVFGKPAMLLANLDCIAKAMLDKMRHFIALFIMLQRNKSAYKYLSL